MRLLVIIVEWCLDDNGLNVLYKNNGADRYPDFKLYKMIARCVHNHTPQAQLQRKEFHSFTFPKKNIPENEKIINIDEMISSSGLSYYTILIGGIAFIFSIKGLYISLSLSR